MRFLHTTASPLQVLTASASITPLDLPVNPLSVLFLRFRVTNVAPAALGTYSAIDSLISQITGIRVLHKGEQIIAGSLRDLMYTNWIFSGAKPKATSISEASGALRSLVFPLCLGHKPYDPHSCFPATTRGNLVLQMDAGALPAAYSAVSWSLETVELIEADPREYVKYVTQSRVSVVGQFDAPLPIGNPLLGILMFDTGLGSTELEVTSWGTVKLLKDNVEQYYPLSDFPTLAGLLGWQSDEVNMWYGHTHQFNGAAAGLAETDQADMAVSLGDRGYAYLDFDPLHDGTYQLETKGAADVKLRGVGLAASAVRYLPIERVSVK